MTGGKMDRVNDHFYSCILNVTPATMRGAVTVIYAPVSHDPVVSESCASVLSDVEMQRAGHFANEHDKSQFEQRRAFRRFCGATVLKLPNSLSLVPFEETAKGRPYLPELANTWFSFSSCRFGFLGAWSSTHGVGVDIEDQSRELDTAELAQHFFSAVEANAVKSTSDLERLRFFFQLWSLKEAALKSIGEGLPFGLDTFEFELEPEIRFVRVPTKFGGLNQFSAQTIETTGHCVAAVVLRNPV